MVVKQHNRAAARKASPSTRSTEPASTEPVASGSGHDGCEISVVMPTASWLGTFAPCARRVLELVAATNIPVEFVIGFDGEDSAVPQWLDRPNVTVVMTGGNAGAAVARNAAAQEARGRILFFVDANAQLAHDAIERVHECFASDPDLGAVFGAFDDEPAVVGVVTQFRSLLRHHTHVIHTGPVEMFWSGCGAVRTSLFLDIGGFDETIGVRSVEDIDLGRRITVAGGGIRLDSRLRCKPLELWTLRSMIETDILDRAVPWTRLMVKTRRLPAALSIDWGARLSGFCTVAAVAALAASPWLPWLGFVVLACALTVVFVNRRFYALCLRKQGPLMAAAAIPLHMLYFFYASVTFGVVLLGHLLFAGRWTSAARGARSSAESSRPLAVSGRMQASH
jgi:glycosyltransferase involved in cell wall biosynthesis